MSLRSGTRSTTLRRRALFGVLLGLSTSCGSPSEPVTASGLPQANGPPSIPPSMPPSAPPAAPPAFPFPGLSRPGAIYAEAYATYPGLASRYVFYEDNSFELQFVSASLQFFKYAGRVNRTDARITFGWDGWSIAGPWGATGTLRGDSLRVEYNLIMLHTDFIDGLYVRAPAAP